MAKTTAEFLREQGKAEGIAEGKQDAVLKLLRLRFQDVPEVLSREISNIHNLTRLDMLLEQAMTVQSLEEIDTHLSFNHRKVHETTTEKCTKTRNFGR